MIKLPEVPTTANYLETSREEINLEYYFAVSSESYLFFHPSCLGMILTMFGITEEEHYLFIIYFFKVSILKASVIYYKDVCSQGLHFKIVII